MEYIHYTNILRDLLDLKRHETQILTMANQLDYLIDDEVIKKHIKILIEHIKEIISDLDTLYYQIADLTNASTDEE